MGAHWKETDYVFMLSGVIDKHFSFNITNSTWVASYLGMPFRLILASSMANVM